MTRLFAAARAGDLTVWSAGIDTRDPAFGPRAQVLFDNLHGLGLSRLSVRLTGAQQRLLPARRALLGPTAEVHQASVSWRLPGEQGTAEQSVWLTVVAGPEGMRLAGTTDGAAPDTPARPIWWLGPVTRVVRGDVTLLLGSRQPSARWTEVAVTATSAARRHLPRPLGRGWSGRVVVEVPSTTADFEQVLGSARGAYASTAAVTRPEGPTTEAAVRVVVNPATARLSAAERRLTLTHEVVHVATGSTSSPAPLWMVEGLAEYVAYESQPAASRATQRRLAAALRRSGLPERLPADRAFSAGAADVTLAYAQAWTACREIGRHRSRDALGRFYASVDGGTPVSEAAEDRLGVDERTLVRWWQSGLRRSASRPPAR